MSSSPELYVSNWLSVRSTALQEAVRLMLHASMVTGMRGPACTCTSFVLHQRWNVITDTNLKRCRHHRATSLPKDLSGGQPLCPCKAYFGIWLQPPSAGMTCLKASCTFYYRITTVMHKKPNQVDSCHGMDQHKKQFALRLDE